MKKIKETYFRERFILKHTRVEARRTMGKEDRKTI